MTIRELARLSNEEYAQLRMELACTQPIEQSKEEKLELIKRRYIFPDTVHVVNRRDLNE